MPEGTRAIVRREIPHPGAPLKLWDHDGWRHQVVVTNEPGSDIAALEVRHRRHATVENRIKDTKDTGGARLPFTRFVANAAWLQLMLTASLLLGALKLLLLDGDLATATPRRLRYTLLHAAGRLIFHARRRILRIPRTWPWACHLLAAYRRLRAAPT